MTTQVKRTIRYGFFQALVFIITLTLIYTWGDDYDFFQALKKAAGIGIIVGILNAFLFYKFALPRKTLRAISVSTDHDEIIKLQTPANYESGAEPISGKLLLTNKRLIFKDHKEENSLELSIPLHDINTSGTFKSWKMFRNGLVIYLRSGVEKKFIVDKLDQWITELKTAYENYKP